jgi:PIN domain nuclease of toxin-antitoxin system
MKLLLDTHIWLWSLADPGRLGRRVLKELKDPANQLWLSAISVWEALLLAEKGRIELPEDRARWVAVATSHFLEAPLTHAIALAAHELSLFHGDPADRFLAATAQVLDLTLVTADERLLGLGDIRSLANR